MLILDQKGGDETLIGLGKDVRSIPSRLQRETDALFNGRKPMDRWYQLHVYEDLERARVQVARAFQTLWAEGDWTVVVDELRALVDKDPDIGIGMRGFWSKMMMRGRSRGVSLINLSQEPWWAPSLFYTQQSHFWVGRVEDERAHKRIKEVGTSRAIMEVLPGIKNHQFLYTDSLEDTRYLAFTRVAR